MELARAPKLEISPGGLMKGSRPSKSQLKLPLITFDVHLTSLGVNLKLELQPKTSFRAANKLTWHPTHTFDLPTNFNYGMATPNFVSPQNISWMRRMGYNPSICSSVHPCIPLTCGWMYPHLMCPSDVRFSDLRDPFVLFHPLLRWTTLDIYLSFIEFLVFGP